MTDYDLYQDVHTEHCCLEHGCKYCDEDCTVVNGKYKQSFPCEQCDDDKTARMNFFAAHQCRYCKHFLCDNSIGDFYRNDKGEIQTWETGVCKHIHFNGMDTEEDSQSGGRVTLQPEATFGCNKWELRNEN